MSSDLSISLLSHNSSNQISKNSNTLPTSSPVTPINMTIHGNSNSTSGTTVPSDQEQESNQSASEGDGTKLNTLNYINFGSYLFNFIVTYGVGTLGWIGNGNNAVLSDKYQTLVTPKATAFSIWAIIFLAQAIFAVIQCLPRFRSLDVIQKGVGQFYAWTSLFQVLWTIAFAYEVIWLSVIFMILIWICLIKIVYNQHYIIVDHKQPNNDALPPPTRSTVMEYYYWLLQFPFDIHCGWITAASLLNVNVVFVSRNVAPYIQLAIGIISLAILHAISVWVLFGIRRNPNYIIAFVLAWANFWIYNELQSPKDSIVERFGGGDDNIVVPGVSLAALTVACVILLQIIFRRIVFPSDYCGEGPLLLEDGNNDQVRADDDVGTPDPESDHYDPPQYAGKFIKEQSPGFNSDATAVMDSPVIA